MFDAVCMVGNDLDVIPTAPNQHMGRGGTSLVPRPSVTESLVMRLGGTYYSTEGVHRAKPLKLLGELQYVEYRFDKCLPIYSTGHTVAEHIPLNSRSNVISHDVTVDGRLHYDEFKMQLH